MTQLMRFSVFLLLLCAHLNISQADCNSTECNSTVLLTSTTTSVSFDSNPNCNLSIWNVSSGQGSITDLNPGTTYMVSVECSNCCKNVTTYPGKVMGINVSEGTTSINLTWSKPNGENIGYRVEWTDGKDPKSAITTETSKSITGLTPGAQYKISVAAVAQDNETLGEKTYVSQYTKPEVVRNLSAINVTTSSMLVTWTEPEGQRSFFRVQWTNGTTNWTISVNETNTTITELMAGVQYNVSVTAVAGDETTESSIAEVSNYTKPGVVRDLSVNNVTTSSVFLSWTEPEGQRSFFRVQWTNREMNDPVNVYQTHTNITNLTAGVQYEFTVTAVAADGCTEGESASFSKYTQPAVVRNLAVGHVTTSSMSLTWTEPEGQRSFYRVQWTHGTTNWTISVNETNTTITELMAGVQYNVSVTAVAGDETTESSIAEVSNYTKPGVVRDLSVNNVTTSSVFLSWTEPEGQRSFFRVQWSNREMNDPVNVYQTHVNITNLTAGVQYEFTVTAVAADGCTEGESISDNKYTQPEVVRNLAVGHVTTSSISLTWTEPEGQRSFYRVQWTNGTTKQIIRVNETNTTITELMAGVQYNVSVTAVAGDETTESSIAEVSNYTKPGVVRDLSVNNVTTSSVFLSWTEPEGQRSFFRVQWTNREMNDPVNVYQTHVNITNLTAGVQYEFTVTAVAADGCTEGESASFSKYTQPAVVRNLAVGHVTTSSISLTWTEPGGQRSFYRVQWTNGTTNWTISVNETNTTITELMAGVQYNVSVTAVAGDETTESSIAEVSNYTKPGVVRDLSVNNVTTSSVFLSWTEPEGQRSFFRVQWTNREMNDPVNVYQTHTNITNLTAGVQYEFTVTAVAADGCTEGESISDNKYTQPEVVRNLAVGHVTTSSMSLTWTEPEGQRSFYRVQWTNGTTKQIIHVNETNTTITELMAGVQYNVSVTAVAGDETTESSIAEVSNYTKPGVVRDLSVNNVTTSSVFLSWTEPEGQRSFFRVQWSNREMNDPVNVYQTHTNITNLTAGVQYEFTVTAVAADGCTEGESASFSKYTQPAVVRNLAVGHVTTSSMSLTWTEPGGQRSFYRVQWTNGTTKQIIRVNETNTTITELMAGVQYNVSVTAVAGDETTESSIAEVSNYTKPGVVRDLSVNNVTTSSVFLSWTEPEGQRSFFRVQWSNREMNDPVNVYQTHVNITNLTAGVQYEFTVTAVAADGCTEGESISDNKYTQPEVVRNLAVGHVTTSSISLTWTEPGGQRSFYRVQWTNGTNKQIISVNETNTTITELMAGVQYNVSVTAVAGDETTESSIAEVSNYTKPGVVRDLSVNNVTTSSVFLSWTEPEGQRSFFRVQWTNREMNDPVNVYQTHTNITNLTAGVQYEFTVTAVAADGCTEGESASFSKYTQPAVVRNLAVGHVTTSSMSLTWTEPEGQRSFYRVQWTHGTTNWTISVNETNTTITELMAGVQYNVSVTAVAGDETTESSIAEVSNYTKPGVVRDLSVNNVTTSSMFLSWIEPEGQRSFFRVQWTNREMNDPVNVYQTHTNITNLTAGVQYEFTVTAVAADGCTEGESISDNKYTQPEVVRNLAVGHVTTSSISLTWTEPGGQRSFYRVQWTNGTNKQIISVNETNTTITELMAGVQYNVSVTAVAGDETTESSIAEVSNYTKPGVVRDLSVNNVTTSSVFLSWTEPEGQRSFFRVQWTNREMNDPVNVYQTHTNITNLTAGVQYEFTVTAVAADGCTEGESASFSKYTQPAVVRNLAVGHVTTSSMSLTWTEPEGQRSFYRVQWTNGTTNWTISVNETNTTITELMAGVQYNVSVTAVAGDETTESSIAEVSNYTKPGVVRDLSVNNVTTSSVFLSWTEPEGQRSFFRVQWTNREMNDPVNVYQTHTNITNLTAGVQYEFTVTAVAADGCTEGESISDNKYTQPEVVRNLAVGHVTTSSISLTWTEPEGQRSFYRVQWTNGTNKQIISVNETNTTITELMAGVQYNVSVTAVAGDETTESSIAEVSNYTKPGVVRDLSVNNVTTSSVFLSWTEPEGQRSFFRVQWTNREMNDPVNVYQTHTNITNLTAGVQYEFTVTAVAADGCTEGESASFSKYTQPEVVRNLAVGHVTTSSMSLTWTEPEGQRSFYRVQWTNGTTNWTISVNETNTTITELMAGVQYNVSVTAVAGDETTESSIAEVSNYTKPGVVRDLSVNNVTTSSVFLSWTEPEGQRSFFRVQWTNREMNDPVNVYQTHTNITNLTAGVQYEFTVTAVAADGCTEGESISDNKYTQPEVVRNLAVGHVTTSSISLTWTEPEGQRSFYRVQWTNGTNKQIISVNETNTTITELMAGVQYNVSVTAVAGDETTESSIAEVSNYTKPGVVRDLSVNNVTTSSVFLSWTEPEGQRSFFRVQWTNREMNDPVNVYQTHVNITNLTAGVQYEFTVTAVAADGCTEGESASFSKYTQPAVVRNLAVGHVTTSSMSLTWTEPGGQRSFYRVQWTNGTTNWTISVNETNTTITELMAGVQYNVSVTAVAGDETTESSIAEVSNYTKPEVAKNLSVINVTTSSVFLSWTEPEGQRSFFRVQWTIREMNAPVNVYQTHVNIPNLTAGVQYEFTVTAVAADGFTEGQSISISKFTLPGKVGNINASPTTSSISLKWDPPNGQVLRYKVNWHNGGIEMSNDTENTSTELQNLSPGTKYTISILAVNAENIAGEPNTVTSVTKPAVVEDLRITEVNTSSVSLMWNKPEGNATAYIVQWTGENPSNGTTNDIRYIIMGLTPGYQHNISVAAVAEYSSNIGESTLKTTFTRPVKPVKVTLGFSETDKLNISWVLREGRVDQYEVEIRNEQLSSSGKNTATETSVLLTGLHPGRVYAITVRAVAGEFNETSDQSLFATVPTPPGSIIVADRTNSSLTLEWATPYLMEGAPDISYQVTYKTPGSGGNQRTVKVQKIELTQLSSGTQHDITVRTVGPQNSLSKPAETSTFTKPNPVSDLAASPQSTTSVEVRWSLPLEYQDYYKYLVQTHSPAGVLINQTVSSSSAVLSELEPGTRYNISVRSIAAPGIESEDEHTFSYTLPNAVTNLIIENETTTTVQLSWLRQSDHKPSYSYQVVVLQGATVVHNNSTKNEMYTVFGLLPGSFYTFNVTVKVAEGVESSVESISNYTRPAGVSDISVIGTTNSLSVSWTKAEGQVESYSVVLYRDMREVDKVPKLSNTAVKTVFENLTAGEKYCVRVITQSGHSFPNESPEVCNATFPNPPGPIMVESQAVDSINFTWPLPADRDPKDYDFRVSTSNGSYLTENNWFLLDKLQSGTLYHVSVVTVGALNYESTAVTTQNYTRPYSVTLLKQKTIITTGSVTLVWEQRESKSHYSYVVQASNNAQAETVGNTTKTISGLSSGSNYSFTVTSQTEDLTQAAPVTVSYFTRPFGVTQLKAQTLSTTTVNLMWMQPLEYKQEYTYHVQTTDCDSQKNKTLQGNFTLISQLTPGTECNFCVAVRAANGIEGEPICTRQYTKPETAQPSISSQGSNSSVLVSWAKPPGNVESFKVYLNDSTDLKVLNSSITSYLFEGLSAGRIYSAAVTSCSGPFNAASQTVTNATFPNPPGPINNLTKTTSSINIKWEEAPKMDPGSFLYQLRNITAKGGDYVTVSSTSYSFTSLLSGTSYNISLRTVGVMEFQSEEVQVNMVTTRPFSVKSVSASDEEEKSIKVTWDEPDQYKPSYRFLLTRSDSFSSKTTADKTFTFKNLDPGKRYNLSVTTVTLDDTQGDSVWTSVCTKASSVKNLRCVAPNKPIAELVLSWTCPEGQYSGFNVTGNSSDAVTTRDSSCNHTVSNLRHHTNYQLAVTTLSCGKSSTSQTLICMTGITNPPIPEESQSLVIVTNSKFNQFTIQVGNSLLSSSHGPITYVGVLLTDDTFDTSDFRTYLDKTYDQWKNKETPAYLATVKSTNLQSRSGGTHVSLTVGDETTWEGYKNGPLQATGTYKYAVVLFTNLTLQDGLVSVSLSLVSSTKLSNVLSLPQDPVVIGLAAGVTLGFFCILFLILIGFIIYWKRLSHKESPDIQIHSMRAKSVAVSAEDFEAYYRKQKADSNCGFAEEFEDLKVVGTGQSKINALNVENKPKNRYNNVLPYDSSRVKLSIIHGSPYDDYINANYIPGYNSKKEFIAAQGPLPHTVKDFWRMVWEKNVQTLVMLTRCNEQGRVKCEQYWDHGTKHYDNIIVTTTSEIPLKDWTIRDFNVKNVKTAETRPVRHFHFTAWPDHGVPETTELLISFRHLVREHMDQFSTHSPTVVHCSAGVGRTGTFIAIDRLIIQIERENTVDVYGIVHDMRMHRPLMVQTEDQYVFLNQCAMDIIRSRTGTNVDLIYQNTAALSIYENVPPKGRNGYYNA